MKIFSREQIYKGDKLTAEKQNITSTELMERAGTKIFDWIHTRMQGAQVPIHIFCGIGNNGGDGLVIGRHLINHGYNVFVYIVNYSDKRSKDFLINYDRIKNTSKKWPELLKDDKDLPIIDKDDIIIDAIFGIGLNRPPDQWVINLFKHLKESGAYTLSVDIPSGLSEDVVPISENAVVWASNTLSFQAPKLVFFLPNTAKYSQTWQVLDIGIDREFLEQTETVAHLIGKTEVLQLYKPREKFSHKGNYGHLMIVGGSLGKMGAMVLSVKGAVYSGAGLVSAYIPQSGNFILQSTIPEAMTILDEGVDEISKIDYSISPTAIAVGPGMGKSESTINALKVFLENSKLPMVLDADALNIIAKNKELLKFLPKETILTPHPKELERLIGKWSNDFEKLKKTRAFAKKFKLIIVVKGAHSITVTKEHLYINTTGNPGLAKGGSGDVLTGIIGSLLAQGYAAAEACIFGVYLHGKSADLSVGKTAYQSLLATDVIEGLGKAFIDLFKTPETSKKPAENNNEEE